MKQFRIYLGRTQGDKLIPLPQVESFIRDAIDPRFDAFTVYDAQGRWKGKGEPSVVIEIIGDDSLRNDVDSVAADYAHTFRQDAVLVTSQDVAFDLITARLEQELALA